MNVNVIKVVVQKEICQAQTPPIDQLRKWKDAISTFRFFLTRKGR